MECLLVLLWLKKMSTLRLKLREKAGGHVEFEVSVEVEVGVEFEVEYEGKGVAIDGSA